VFKAVSLWRDMQFRHVQKNVPGNFFLKKEKRGPGIRPYHVFTLEVSHCFLYIMSIPGSSHSGFGSQ
jgi:hypothetical protein